MSDIDVKVTDYSDLVLQAFEVSCLRALTTIGETAVGYATKLVRVDTGLLKNSITYAIEGNPAAKSSYKADRGDGKGTYTGVAPNDNTHTVYIGTNVVYAKTIEFGDAGRNRTAYPYLKPTINDHTTEYRQIIRDQIGGSGGFSSSIN